MIEPNAIRIDEVSESTGEERRGGEGRGGRGGGGVREAKRRSRQTNPGVFHLQKELSESEASRREA